MENNKEIVKTVNWIIDKIIKPYQKELLVGLMFYIGKKNKYVLEFTILRDFKSYQLLKNSCFQITDDILTFFDITDVVDNFDIRIRTPSNTIVYDYFYLLNELEPYTILIGEHPRKEKYNKWLLKNNEIYFMKKNNKSFFRKIKEIVLSLLKK